MSTIQRHLDGIEDNLRDARHRAIAVYGEVHASDRNEQLLRLLQDLTIVEEHLESAKIAAMVAAEKAREAESPVHVVSEADDPVALARAMQQKRHGGPS